MMKTKKYWLQSTEESNNVVEVRPEVSFSMTSAAKYFLERTLNDDKLKSKIRSGKLPVNCGKQDDENKTVQH